MSNVVSLSQCGRIEGQWKFRDGFSTVEFSISVVGEAVRVAVVDTSDGERPEVYGVQWSEKTFALQFAVHWSTGHFQKYSVTVGPDRDRVQATITSTTQELWERQ